jgi:hypothetical protein
VTWANEHSVESPIVAGAYVGPEIAWLAAAGGTVLRRTSVGWFETSARAEGEVASIRASSPARASVTLEDGRTFDTTNAGVTWTEAAPSDQVTDDATSRAAKRPRGSRRAARARP